MRLIICLLCLLYTNVLAETSVSGNLLPNSGTGQTSVQNSNSTIDGINNSSNWTLDNVTDYSSNFNELEANGTGTVSVSATAPARNTRQKPGRTLFMTVHLAGTTAEAVSGDAVVASAAASAV